MANPVVTTSGPSSGRAPHREVEPSTVGERLGSDRADHLGRHPSGSAVIAMLDGKAVCVEQYRPAVAMDLLEIPAGRPKNHESPEETAKRELLEETGLIATDVQWLGDFYNAPHFSDSITHAFLATTLAPRGDDSVSGVLRTRLVDLAEIEDLVRSGHLIDAKSIAALLMARQALSKTGSLHVRQQRETSHAPPSLNKRARLPDRPIGSQRVRRLPGLVKPFNKLWQRRRRPGRTRDLPICPRSLGTA